MNSIADLDVQIQDVVNQIREAESKILNLEGNLVERTRDYEFWKKTIGQFRDEKTQLQTKENHLRAQKVELLKRQSAQQPNQQRKVKLVLFESNQNVIVSTDVDGRIDRETLQQLINNELLDGEIARVTGLQIYSESDKRWSTVDVVDGHYYPTLANPNSCYKVIFEYVNGRFWFSSE